MDLVRSGPVLCGFGLFWVVPCFSNYVKKLFDNGELGLAESKNPAQLQSGMA